MTIHQIAGETVGRLVHMCIYGGLVRRSSHSGKQSYSIYSLWLPKTPEVILLNIWRALKLPDLTRDLISILVLAAKNVIASHWNSHNPPTLHTWYSKVWEFAIIDKIADKLLCSEDPARHSIFIKKWYPYLTTTMLDSNLNYSYSRYYTSKPIIFN